MRPTEFRDVIFAGIAYLRRVRAVFRIMLKVARKVHGTVCAQWFRIQRGIAQSSRQRAARERNQRSLLQARTFTVLTIY
jgi:hypothetical protein